MNKSYCDLCNAEINEDKEYYAFTIKAHNAKFVFQKYDSCPKCFKKLSEFLQSTDSRNENL